MRQPSRTAAHRLGAGALVVVLGGLIGFVVATDRAATALAHDQVATAAGTVVRTGATSDAAVVPGGAAATGASAAALPDITGSETVLLMAGAFLLLCAAAAYALLRSSHRERMH
jgi:hypothetical protein